MARESKWPAKEVGIVRRLEQLLEALGVHVPAAQHADHPRPLGDRHLPGQQRGEGGRKPTSAAWTTGVRTVRIYYSAAGVTGITRANTATAHTTTTAAATTTTTIAGTTVGIPAGDAADDKRGGDSVRLKKLPPQDFRFTAPTAYLRFRQLCLDGLSGPTSTV